MFIDLFCISFLVLGLVLGVIMGAVTFFFYADRDDPD